MENFIPKTKEELVNQMKGDNFKGNYYIQDNFIIWNISDKISLKILLYNQPDIAFITYSCNIDNKTLYVTEDEPLMEELYDYLSELNKETNTLIIKKTIFGKSARIYWQKDKNFDELKFNNNKKYEIYKF